MANNDDLTSLLAITRSWLVKVGYPKAAKQINRDVRKRGILLVEPDFEGGIPTLDELYSQWKEENKIVAGGDDAESSAPSSMAGDSDDDSSDSSDSEAEPAKEPAKGVKVVQASVKQGTKRKASDSSSSSSSDSSSSEDSSDSEDEKAKPAAKKAKTEAASKPIDISDDSSSSSDSEDSSDAAGEASKPESDSESSSGSSSSSSSSSSSASSSSSSSSSESEAESASKPKSKVTSKKFKKDKKENKPSKKSDIKPSRSDSTSSSATLIEAQDTKPTESTSDTLLIPAPAEDPVPDGMHPDRMRQLNPGKKAPQAQAIPATKENLAQLKKDKVPFSRIPKDQYVDPRLASNAFVPYDYANRAHEKLIVTKGKGFTKEKNKGKKGSYKGGKIDFTPKGIKFDD